MSDGGVIGIKITGDATGLEQSLRGAGREVDSFSTKVKDSSAGMAALANGLKSAFIGSSIAVGIIGLKNTIGEFTQAMVQAQIQVDKLRNGLNFAVGRGNSGAELDFIRNSAKSLGLEFVSTAQQYTKLAAAARGTSLEGANTRAVFESIAQASTVMGLSAQETEGALLAVTQMISKGKVQAEELRGQLGERLPGAFQVAARAMGVTTAELDKMLETGQVLASDFLPKFARQLSQEVAPEVEAASKSMQGSINKLSNAWTEFKQALAGGTSDSIASGASRLTNVLAGVAERMRDAKASGLGFVDTLSEIALGSAGTLGKKLEGVNLELAAMQVRLAKEPNNPYLKSAIAEADAYRLSLADAIAKRRELQGGSGGAPYVSGMDRRLSESAAAASAEREAKKRREDGLKSAMTTYATDGEKLATELKKQKDLLGDLYTPELEARIRKHFIKPTKDGADAFAAQRDAAKEWAKFYEEFVGLGAKAEAETLGLNKAQEKLVEYLKSPAYQNMAEPARQLVLQAAYAAIAQEQLGAEIKDAAKEAADAAKAYDKLVDSEGKLADNAEDKVRKQLEQNAAIGLSTEALGELEAANLRLHAVELERKANLQEIIYNDQKLANATRDEAAALRNLADAKVVGASKKAATEAAKTAAEEWKKAAEQIEGSITDALMRGFESGKGFAKNLRDTVVNMFQTMVLRPVVQATVAGTLSTAGSLVNAATGTASAASGSSSFLGGFNPLSSIMNFASGGATSAFAGAFSSGLELAAGGFGAEVAAAGSLMMESATGFASYAAGAGQMLAGSASSFAAALGPVGLAIGGIALLAALFGGGGRYVQSTGESVSNYGTTGNLTDRADVRYGYANNAGADKFADGLQKSYMELATSLGIGLARTTFSYGGNDAESPSGKGKFRVGGYGTTGDVTKSFDSGEIDNADGALALAASRAVLTALTGSDLPKYLTGYLDEITGAQIAAMGQDQITSVLQSAQQYQQLNAAIAALPFANLRDQTYTVYKALTDAAGGMEQFGQKLNTYYTNFYSAEEQKAQLVKNLNAALAKAGLEVDVSGISRAQYRALVEAQDLTTESGRAAYSAMIELAGSFAQLTTSAGDAGDAVEKLRAASLKLVDSALSDVSNAVDAQVAGLEAQRDAQLKLLQTQLDGYRAQLDAARAVQQEARSLANNLKAAFQDSVGYTAESATAYLRQALAGAQATGSLPNWDSLQPAVAAARNINEGDYATALDFAMAKGGVADVIQSLGGYADQNATAADKQVAAMEQLITTNEAAQELARQQFQEQIDTAKAQLTAAQAAVDAINGVNTSVLSVRDAIGALGGQILAFAQSMSNMVTNAAGAKQVVSAVAQAKTIGATATNTFADSEIKNYVTGLDPAASEENSYRLYAQAVANGVSATRLDAVMGWGDGVANEWARKHDLPAFAVGTNYVPHDMVALVHQGEAIVPKAYNPMAGGQQDSNVAAEIRALREQVAILQSVMESNTRHAANTAQTLQRVMPDGDALQTRAIA